jgi:ATP-dependent Clp protease protease subunit
VEGQASDMKIHTDHIIRIRQKMNTMYSEMTGQPLEVIERDTERDFYMTAEEAQQYGLVDKVIEKRN